jgi:hypothetical protein
MSAIATVPIAVGATGSLCRECCGYTLRNSKRSERYFDFVNTRYENIDDLITIPAGAEFRAAEKLVKTPPTTIEGITALLDYVARARKSRRGVCRPRLTR